MKDYSYLKSKYLIPSITGGRLIFHCSDGKRYYLVHKSNGTSKWEEIDEFTEWVKETRKNANK